MDVFIVSSISPVYQRGDTDLVHGRSDPLHLVSPPPTNLGRIELRPVVMGSLVIQDLPAK